MQLPDPVTRFGAIRRSATDPPIPPDVQNWAQFVYTLRMNINFLAPTSLLSQVGPGDDLNGQLPGTGIPGDTGDSLYRSSSLRRRRDASPGRGTVESVGQEGVGVVPERPSLFSTSGSSSFNPFSAALSSLRPEERAEVNQTGVSDALQRYANQEMRRLFAEHLRSLPQEPISSSFDLFGMSSRVMSAGETAQGSGVAGGTSQVYHIGTPSGSENTGSSIFQSIPSQRSSIPSHPTSSPISFGPSTPVMSARRYV